MGMSRWSEAGVCLAFASGVVACSPPTSRDGARSTASLIGSLADPGPVVAFVQNGLAVGIDRANEPPSAAACPAAGITLSYGTFLADFDGDGRLDVYDVNHGQQCHRSGLWLNGGTGSFGSNLYTVAVQPAPQNGASLGLTNQVTFVGDLTGDGRVDLHFGAWGGLAGLCVNQGSAAHADWTGPSFLCYATTAARRFGDVNGDGKIDVEVLDPAAATYDVYRDYCKTLPTTWKLNNGDPNINTWPTDANAFHFVGLAAPGVLLDFNQDGLPDRLQGVEVASAERGPYGSNSGGLRLLLGQSDGTYLQVTSGLENVQAPVVRTEDIDEDGCLDVGTDITGYRDNVSWYIQSRSGSTCLATFQAVARSALPYHPGARRYTLDVDNDGLLDKVALVHNGYGSNDGLAGGVHIFRKLTSGAYQDLGAAGINIHGSAGSEFYADGLDPGDWDGDGKVDLAGVGPSSIAGTDAGIALWTSNLVTTNRWLKVRTPDVSGFFTGAANIEIFEAGAAGDPSQYVTPPLVLRTGRAWASQVHHFGVGTRATVDVRVTFPDGRQSIQSAVATNSTIVVEPIANLPPVASAIAIPTTGIVGQAIAFDGSGSSDADGLVANFAWSFGDGATGSGALVSHPYAAAGTFVATLTVRDDRGRTATAQASVSISDPEAPTAPSNLTATVVSSGRIDLAWAAAADNVGVTGYLVERCQEVGCASFSQIATTTGTSFADIGLAAGTSYSYRVRATDAVTNLGDVSNTASATTGAPDAEAPGAPSSLTATASSSGQIDLAWAAATDNVGVTVHAIERCQGVGCAGFAQIATSTGTTFSNTGLAASTSYSYRVRAQDGASNLGPYSSTASATTYSPSANPSFVQGNYAVPQTATAAVPVPFKAAQAAGDLNVAIVGWTNNNIAQLTGVVDSRGNAYELAIGPTVIGNRAQVIYYAKNIVAAPASGNIVTVTFNAGAQNADVRILEYSGIDTTSPLDAAVGGSGSSNSSATPAMTTTNTRDLLVAGNNVASSTLGAGTGFTSRFVTNPNGDIAEDRVVTATGSYTATAPLGSAGAWVMQMVAFKAASGPPDTQAPTVPSNLTATAVLGSQINLAWTAATDNVGVTGYLVERCQGEGCANFAQVATSTGTTFSNTGLAASTSYSYRVRAQDAASNLGPYSSTASATTYSPSANPSFVQGNYAVPQTATAAVPVSFKAAQAAGDLNVAIVGWTNNNIAQLTGVVDSRGNAYELAIGPTVIGNRAQVIYYAKNIVAAPAGGNIVTVSFTAGAQNADVRVLEYSGIDTTSPLDAAVGGSGSSNSSATPAMTTTNARDLLVAGNNVASWTLGAGAGFTSRFVTNPNGDIAEDRVVTATGSYTATAPLGSAGAWIMQMVAFKAR